MVITSGMMSLTRYKNVQKHNESERQINWNKSYKYDSYSCGDKWFLTVTQLTH